MEAERLRPYQRYFAFYGSAFKWAIAKADFFSATSRTFFTWMAIVALLIALYIASGLILFIVYVVSFLFFFLTAFYDIDRNKVDDYPIGLKFVLTDKDGRVHSRGVNLKLDVLGQVLQVLAKSLIWPVHLLIDWLSDVVSSGYEVRVHGYFRDRESLLTDVLATLLGIFFLFVVSFFPPSAVRAAAGDGSLFVYLAAWIFLVSCLVRLFRYLTAKGGLPEIIHISSEIRESGPKLLLALLLLTLDMLGMGLALFVIAQNIGSLGATQTLVWFVIEVIPLSVRTFPAGLLSSFSSEQMTDARNYIFVASIVGLIWYAVYARNLLRLVAGVAPDEAGALKSRAAAALDSGRYTDAVDLLNRHRGEVFAHPRLLSMYMRALGGVSDYDEMKAVVKDLWRRDPEPVAAAGREGDSGADAATIASVVLACHSTSKPPPGQTIGAHVAGLLNGWLFQGARPATIATAAIFARDDIRGRSQISEIDADEFALKLSGRLIEVAKNLGDFNIQETAEHDLLFGVAAHLSQDAEAARDAAERGLQRCGPSDYDAVLKIGLELIQFSALYRDEDRPRAALYNQLQAIISADDFTKLDRADPRLKSIVSLLARDITRENPDMRRDVKVLVENIARHTASPRPDEFDRVEDQVSETVKLYLPRFGFEFGWAGGGV